MHTSIMPSGRTANEFNGIEYLTVSLTSTPMMICAIYKYNFHDPGESLNLSNLYNIYIRESRDILITIII